MNKYIINNEVYSKHKQIILLEKKNDYSNCFTLKDFSPNVAKFEEADTICFQGKLWPMLADDQSKNISR